MTRTNRRQFLTQAALVAAAATAMDDATEAATIPDATSAGLLDSKGIENHSITLQGGTQADYTAAAQVYSRMADKVFPGAVTAHWSADNRFWYRNDLQGGKREFILVDAARATRRPAFNAPLLAAALQHELGGTVDAERLPVDNIAFTRHPFVLLVQSGTKTWRYNTKTHSLTPSRVRLGRLNPINPGMEPFQSGTAGLNTTITFVNETQGAVHLYWINGDGHEVAYGDLAAGHRRVQNTYAGHLWLVKALDGRSIVKFEAQSPPSFAVIDHTPSAPPQQQNEDPSISPDGTWRITHNNFNLQLVNISTGAIRSLTTDGTADDGYTGQPHWSPDSQKVVVCRVQPEQRHTVYEVESSPTTQLQPLLVQLQYLKPGDRVEVRTPWLFNLANNVSKPVPETLIENPWEITDIYWHADSSAYEFRYTRRGFNHVRLIAVSSDTAEAMVVIDEPSDTFIDWSSKLYLHRVTNSNQAVWMSERDGWNHLYLFDLKFGRVVNQITRGEWVVRGIERIDDTERQIWFRASGIYPDQDPYFIHYCRVNFDGTGLIKLTSGDGTHTVSYSPDGQYFVDVYSRVDMAPVSCLRKTHDGSLVMELERSDCSALTTAGFHLPEPFKSRGRDGQTDIYGVIVRPSNFNPHRKYPVVENIYAGPQDSFVPKAFGACGGLQQIAELGFIVVQIDGMGTNNRSRAFHDVCWKNLKDAGFPDRILWIKAAALSRKQMDLTRMGIYGTSAGGQNALAGLLFHGDFYHVGMADSGCHDNRMDKIWWNEQWMGWPVGPQYAESSNTVHASQLTGKLLLMVGELDNNVDPASTMQVVNALIANDKDFELLVKPGGGHGVAGTPYGYRRLQDFLVKNLLGVVPRAITPEPV